MSRRVARVLLYKALPALFPSRSLNASVSPQLLVLSTKNALSPYSPAFYRFYHATPSPQSAFLRDPWRYWKTGGSYALSAGEWYGGLKSIAGRLRTQALESYCIWHGPLLKAHPFRDGYIEGEMFTGVLRNSRSWVSSFAVGVMRPEKWLCVAAATSLNTVGAHIPRMSFLLLAQILAKAGSAEMPSRDAYFPLRAAPNSTSTLQLTASPFMRALLQIWNEIRLCGRLCALILYFLPLFLTYPMTTLDPALWKWWLASLRHTLESCGPAFIKWGQWASTRRDLFAPDVAHELRKLQTDSPAHSGEISRKAVESAFGLPIDTLFDSFEDEPLASGSIGQVHRANLSPVGATVTGVKANTPVAIKAQISHHFTLLEGAVWQVRHPDVDLAFQRDMKLMLWIAQCIDRFSFLKGFNLHEMICQFAVPMAEQVDLCVEAANLQCFRHNFRKNTQVVFPEPLFPLVTSDILVETFQTGSCVQDIIEQVDTKDTSLAELGSSTYFDMVVRHNLLHADLHPGNILVEYGPPKTHLRSLLEHLSDEAWRFIPSEKWNPFPYLIQRLDQGKELCPSLILLDAGMATQLSDKERYHMLGIFRSVAEMDGEACAEHALSFAGAKQTCPDPDSFRRDMLTHFERVMDPDWSEEEFEASVDAFGHVIDIIRGHRVALPGQIVSCLFTAFLLEGWANKLDPEHSLMQQIKSMLKKLDWSLERRIKEEANNVLINGISNLSLQVSSD